MSAQLLCCPYCNSSVDLATSRIVGERVQCPRCQELFPHPAAAALATDDRSVPKAATPSPSAHRSNRTVAGVVLGVMTAMAALGLIFAWLTIETRRNRDRLANMEPTRVVPIAPAELKGLGYLPADTNVIAGIHIAELMENPQSRALITRANGGSPSLGSNQIEKWTGIDATDLDHAVLGLKIANDRLLPRWTLVVQTRRPYDPTKVLKTMKAGDKVKRNGRTLHRFKLEQPPISGALWFPADRVLIIGMSEEDFDVVPSTPTPGIERFTSSLTPLFREQLHTGTQAWLVGHVTEWQSTLTVLALVGAKNDEKDLLSNIRTLGTWLQFGDVVNWNMTVRCTDADAASALSEYLAARGLEPGKRLSFFDKQPEADSLVKELSRSLTIQLKAETLNLRAQVQPATVLQAVGNQNP